tara:strand:- start:381 stop:2045 length:1665 start_codon:yes stop_codon:yes gene_type:complete
MGSISKVIKRVIPKEIQPILPIAASMFGGPLVGSYLGGLASTAKAGSFLNALNNPIVSNALGSGITSAGVDLLTSGKVDPKTLATSTLFGAGGEYFKGLKTGNKFLGMELGDKAAQSFQDLGNLIAPTSVDKGKFELTGDIVKGGSTALTAGGSISAYNAAEEAQNEYDEMMAGREADSAANRQSRIDYITRYMGLAGFSQSEIDEALNNAGYQNGGRVGYRIGGGPVKSFIAKLLNAEPTEEVMQKMVEERKKEILNEMFDPEAETGAYSMQQMQEANEMATKQAMKELEEFKMRIGMDLGDPPEGSVADDMIDQIMEPREKEEFLPTAPPRDMINEEREFLPTALPRDMRKDGGRIKKSIGGLAFMYKDYLEGANKYDIEPITFEEFTEQYLDVKREEGKAEGGRIEYEEGGDVTNLPPSQRSIQEKLRKFVKENGRTPSTDSEVDSVYGKGASEREMTRVGKTVKSRSKVKKAKDGGIMNLNMGGMPAEMDLRGGGFVPLGAKEKADDVPARLSKNEFVMTADAVRAAGGGSVNKGAKRMYDLMNNLEARV